MPEVFQIPEVSKETVDKLFDEYFQTLSMGLVFAPAGVKRVGEKLLQYGPELIEVARDSFNDHMRHRINQWLIQRDITEDFLLGDHD